MLTWMPELYNRSLMRMTSFTDEEMMSLIDLAAQLKARRAAGIRGDLLHRKNVALIFEKSSTRTRNSSLIAIRDEGGNAEYLTRPDIHFGKKESVKDTARVLGRIYDGIRFNLMVNDNDGDGRDATIEIVPNTFHSKDIQLAPVVRWAVSP